jgi:hypothetical protein
MLEPKDVIQIKNTAYLTHLINDVPIQEIYAKAKLTPKNLGEDSILDVVSVEKLGDSPAHRPRSENLYLAQLNPEIFFVDNGYYKTLANIRGLLDGGGPMPITFPKIELGFADVRELLCFGIQHPDAVTENPIFGLYALSGYDFDTEHMVYGLDYIPTPHVGYIYTNSENKMCFGSMRDENHASSKKKGRVRTLRPALEHARLLVTIDNVSPEILKTLMIP